MHRRFSIQINRHRNIRAFRLAVGTTALVSARRREMGCQRRERCTGEHLVEANEAGGDDRDRNYQVNQGVSPLGACSRHRRPDHQNDRAGNKAEKIHNEARDPGRQYVGGEGLEVSTRMKEKRIYYK